MAREDREPKQLEDYDWKQKQLEDIDLNGFTVDSQGNMFFTVPVLFTAFRLSADGELTGFGRAGSGRGKFGVVAGIATDEMGYIYVSDRLRCVVLVFDPNLQFQTEFGYRGDQPSNLIVPDDLAIDRERQRLCRAGRESRSQCLPGRPRRAVHGEAFEGSSRSGLPERSGRAEQKLPRRRSSRRRSRKWKLMRRGREAEVDEEVVQEATSPSQGSKTASRDFEESGQVIEEDLPDEVESIVDRLIRWSSSSTTVTIRRRQIPRSPAGPSKKMNLTKWRKLEMRRYERH